MPISRALISFKLSLTNDPQLKPFKDVLKALHTSMRKSMLKKNRVSHRNIPAEFSVYEHVSGCVCVKMKLCFDKLRNATRHSRKNIKPFGDCQVIFKPL